MAGDVLEVVDLNKESLYKMPDLINRTDELLSVYKDVFDFYDYLETTEESYLDSAAKRFQLKRMLTSVATVYALMANILLGIAAYFVLNQKANKDFAIELGSFSEKLSKFDSERLTKIAITLENSKRILKNKVHAMAGKTDDNSRNTIFANFYISLFLKQEMSEADISLIPEHTKEKIISILQNDLDTEENDLFILLKHLKQQNDNNIKLIHSYTK